jgi:AraC family transcriptional activator of pobA
MSVQSNVIPSFFLYGEAPRRIDDRFLHIEDLDYRSRPSDWRIAAHSHKDLHHLIHVTVGGGTATVDERTLPMEPTCLLLIPAGRVHGFAFLPETSGRVLTVADSFLGELIRREPGFERLFANPICLTLPEEPAVCRIACGFAQLSRELVWQAPAHASAVEAELLTILVTMLRRAHEQLPDKPAPPGPRRELVARFRAAIEQSYRTDRPLEAYANALGVTVAQLRAACLSIAGSPPRRLIQERVALEAKRLLLYTNMAIAEIAYALGFDDPAYFSRFFTEQTGLSPRAFRTTRHEA